jgi:hypothetical protein
MGEFARQSVLQPCLLKNALASRASLQVLVNNAGSSVLILGRHGRRDDWENRTLLSKGKNSNISMPG